MLVAPLQLTAYFAEKGEPERKDDEYEDIYTYSRLGIHHAPHELADGEYEVLFENEKTTARRRRGEWVVQKWAGNGATYRIRAFQIGSMLVSPLPNALRARIEAHSGPSTRSLFSTSPQP